MAWQTALKGVDSVDSWLVGMTLKAVEGLIQTRGSSKQNENENEEAVAVSLLY